MDTVSLRRRQCCRQTQALKGPHKISASPSIFLGAKSVSIEPKRITNVSVSQSRLSPWPFSHSYMPSRRRTRSEIFILQISRCVIFWVRERGKHPSLIADQYGSRLDLIKRRGLTPRDRSVELSHWIILLDMAASRISKSAVFNSKSLPSLMQLRTNHLIRPIIPGFELAMANDLAKSFTLTKTMRRERSGNGNVY